MPVIEFEVRAPKFNLWQRFKEWYYGYSFAREQFQRRLPDNGNLIELTWLPNPRNARFEKNCHIGSKGIVFDMDKEDGSFCLKMESGATLVCLRGDFNYKLFINHPPPHLNKGVIT